MKYKFHNLYIFKKNNGLVRSIVLYVFGPLLTQNDFYLQSLSLFTGIDCVNGLVLNLLPNCEHFWNIFCFRFFKNIFCFRFFIIFFDLVTSFPNDLFIFQNVWPLSFLTFTKEVKNQRTLTLVFDLFCRGQERKRSNILKIK